MENEKTAQEDRSYCVYVHTNKMNGKKYVGQTCQLPPERRWKNGDGYRGCLHFYSAIKKYGWDNFEHEILHDNLTKEEADKLENELIKKYNTTNNECGYNIKEGGAKGRVAKETILKLSKSVGQYSVDGQLIKIWDSITDVERELNINTANISSCCLGTRRTSGGYIWLYNNGNLPFHLDEDYLNKIRINGNSKAVNQYTKDGAFIKTWFQIQDAANELDIIDSCISQCCKNEIKTAGGFIWRYANDVLTDEHIIWTRHKDGGKKKRKIIQYDKYGNFIKTWNSVADARSTLGINNIFACLNNRQKSAGGYIWKYAND